MHPDWLYVHTETADALADGRPVVAMESTLISHGLPWPANLETARQAEAAVRAAGAVPATVAVVRGRPTMGLNDRELEEFARATGVVKASRRDLGAAVGLGRTAATTVSATMVLARAAGVRVFATGGIGGAHRQQPSQPLDISADLMELSRTPVLVVCAGAKSILDLPQTLEFLESFGVPVLGYRTDEFPVFCVRGSGGPVSARVGSPAEAAAVYDAHVRMGGRGAVLVQPVDASVAVSEDVFSTAMRTAEAEAQAKGIRGADVTPFLLARLAELTDGKTLAANRALIVANARLAAEVAGKLE
ncbi:MAG TPA: pseudouridine-5'-phosphate glycosidase [Fimbriiglobus sp.]|nr:pseudouridine-5'-phosphate glycosidase [Fimbriiglobus sp.]